MMNNYNNFFNQKKNLISIGNKLSDFEDNYISLGEGNYGIVVKAKSKLDNLYYAIKRIYKENLNRKHFIRETEILKNLNHENIINFYGFFEEQDSFFLVFEYAQNGSLKDYIKKYRSNFPSNQEIIPFKEDFVIKVFKDILNGLKYLHSNNILHRDIKPDNILLDENMTAKITDFGISAIYLNNNNNIKINKANILVMNNTIIGHKDYIPPEMIEGNKYDFKVDIFSLGLTLFNLMSFNLPFNSIIKNKDEIERNLNENIINQLYSLQLRNLVLMMINENPNKRPNAFEAYNLLMNIEQNNQNILAFQNNQSRNFQNNNNNISNFQQLQNNQNAIYQNFFNNSNNQNNFQINNFQNNQNNNFQNNQNNNIQNNQNNNFQNFQNNNFPNNQNNNFQNTLSDNFQNNQNFQNIQNNSFISNQNNQNNNFQNNQNNDFQNIQNYNFQNFFQNFQNNQNQNFQNNQNLQINQNFQNNQNFQINQNFQKNQSKNNNISKNGIFENQNYSLLRVIECLCNIKELNIEKTKAQLSIYCKDENNFITFDILDILKLIKLNLQKKTDKNNFANKIIEFIDKLSSKMEKNKNNIEIDPNLIFGEIFKIFNEDFKNAKIPWNNNIFNKIKEIEDLPLDSFPEIYNKIKKFKKEYKNPFVDITYFLSLDIIKCPDCSNITDADIHINYSIYIPSKFKGNIETIIKNYMALENSEEKCKCSQCYYRGPGKKEKAFYISPKYLIIDIKDTKVNFFEEPIDLSKYILSNKGPKKYSLFALINKENNSKYIGFIKNENDWIFCSQENNVEKCSFDSLNCGIPHIAIYKGLD